MAREKKEKKEKKKRRGGAFLFILILLLIIAALIWFLLFGGGLGFGGNGSGFGEGSSSQVSADVNTGADNSGESSEETTVAVIRIDGEEIYFNGELCADENALKDKITQTSTEKEYELDHSNAIKATYDKVKAVLIDLESALGIKVNYNE